MSSDLKLYPKNVKEIKIDMPWGYVAGKIWGEESNPFILCFHGILDNAGSFDNIIQYLPDSYCYIAFDLPGHGLSSHFPPHLPIFTLSYIPVYRIIVEYFKREKYIIMGHSYGGQLGFLFAQLYPEYVEKLIMLDTITFFPVSTKQIKHYLADHFDQYLVIEHKINTKKPPTYTYEEALERLIAGRRYGSINEAAGRALLKRAVKLCDDGKYMFTADQRLKNFINPIRDFRYTNETMKHFRVHCPILMVLGDESSAQQIYMAPVLKTFKKWRNCTIVQVAGNHDVHNEYPERVAPHVVKFLEKKKAKL